MLQITTSKPLEVNTTCSVTFPHRSPLAVMWENFTRDPASSNYENQSKSFRRNVTMICLKSWNSKSSIKSSYLSHFSVSRQGKNTNILNYNEKASLMRSNVSCHCGLRVGAGNFLGMQRTFCPNFSKLARKNFMPQTFSSQIFSSSYSRLHYIFSIWSSLHLLRPFESRARQNFGAR